MNGNSSGETDEITDYEVLELRGNTLRIYWIMLRVNRPHRARELQRLVGLSSSSLALHHLNNLIDHGLVTTDEDGCYIIKRHIRPGLLSLFVGSGRLHIPRYIFYAILNTALLLSSIYLFVWSLNAATVLLIACLSMNSVFSWIESIRLWRLQPRY